MKRQNDQAREELEKPIYDLLATRTSSARSRKSPPPHLNPHSIIVAICVQP
jgi:hypothetical protein